MSATAKAEGPMAVAPDDSNLQGGAAGAAVDLPAGVLNWREARFYGRYGEVELHLLEFLCRRDRDAIDVGANDGSYVHYLRRHARQVIAFEPMPSLANALRPSSGAGSTSQSDRVVRPRRQGRAAHAGGRWRRGDRLLDRLAGGIGHLSRPSRHRGADGRARQRLRRRGRLHQDRRRRPRAGRARRRGGRPSGVAGRACWSRSRSACRRAASARAKAYFKQLGYRGYFVQAGHLEPIDLFSASTPAEPGQPARPHGAACSSASDSAATSTISSSCRQTSRSRRCGRCPKRLSRALGDSRSASRMCCHEMVADPLPVEAVGTGRRRRLPAAH